ncbi:hypothetical protein [Simiduia aestuariiviva]|uniref:Uncharacterized protein n=1 Tax=Simiduia aestuariiviva TaxID=1510459 RepID=A0A839UNM7_9GAMM|nr:hypothetical protein [Simiduia aestuariiviva]MBB3169442.1 hypothetical protein [Simiduia aestuariiviva]
MKFKLMQMLMALVGIISLEVSAERDNFWDYSYQQCFQSADVVIEGKVIDYEKVGYNGNEQFGYTHYLISIEVLKSIKGFEGKSLQYHVWYEGKEHGIEGSSLFCLCLNQKVDLGDPEGFGRLSLGEHYKNYLHRRETGEVKPIDESDKNYVPYCGA